MRLPASLLNTLTSIFGFTDRIFASLEMYFMVVFAVETGTVKNTLANLSLDLVEHKTLRDKKLSDIQ